MRVLVTGGSGQLGNELMRRYPGGFHVTAPSSRELDISDKKNTFDLVRLIRPDIIINSAAYTAVDIAELQPDRAFAVNTTGAANIAAAAASTGARLIHISTDFVFDGKKSSPYLPDDPARPISVYGSTKLQGERRVMEIMGGSALIVRTSWVYSMFGRNFVKTMLKLMKEKSVLRVVADQAGTPTWAGCLAEIIWKAALMNEVNGIVHWSDSGIASWYDFACAVLNQALSLGMLEKGPDILPVSTEEYPTPARRPAYSVLDKRQAVEFSGIIPPHWQANLDLMLEEYRDCYAAGQHGL